MEKIKTRAYGVIEADPSQKINFVKPILGFDEYRYYYIIEMKELPNFYWLQSAENPDLAFIIVDPRLFIKDYELDIEEADFEYLQYEEGNELLDYTIINASAGIDKMTANLLGPIVINATKRIAIQAISIKDNYGTKHPIFESIKKETGE